MRQHLVRTTLLIILTLLCSCDKGSDTPFATVDFTYSAKSSNVISFEAQISGNYEYIEWIMPNNKVIKNQTAIEYYFPLSGQYDVTVRINKNFESVQVTKKIVISKDDPLYEMPLVWSDEFDGNSLNLSNWRAEVGVKVNNELQAYVDSPNNYEVNNGLLTITARKVNEDKVYGSYTSARLVTMGSKEFTYGRMEIRAKLPLGRGTWPAIWMLGSSINKGTPWPACGEIDIMEYVGYNPGVVKSSLHTSAASGAKSANGDYRISNEGDWHIYGMDWSAESMKFWVDTPTNIFYTYAPSQKTATNWPFNKPHFFILNVAIGGNWGGLQGIDNTIFPVSMQVDYVRVYQY